MERPREAVLSLITVSHLLTHVTLGVGVLYPVIMAEFGLSFSHLGLIGSALVSSSVLLQIVFSLMSRYIAKRVLLGLGSLLSGLGSFFAGLASTFLQLVGAVTLMGAGTAPQHPIGTTLISERYGKDSRAWAFGVHFGFAYIGNVIGPLAMTLIAASLGWRYAIGLLVFPASMLGVVILWYLKGGYGRYGRNEFESSGTFKQELTSALRSKNLIRVTAAQSLMGIGTGVGVFVNFIPVFLTETFKITSYEAGIIYSIASAGAVAGPILLGKVSARVGSINVAFGTVILASALIYLLTLHRGVTVLLVAHLFVLALLGFSITTLLQAHLADVLSPSQREAAMGIYFTIGFGSSPILIPVMGYLIDVTGSFSTTFAYISVIGAAAAILLAPEMVHRSRT